VEVWLVEARPQAERLVGGALRTAGENNDLDIIPPSPLSGTE
jgi:hypothetical protein